MGERETTDDVIRRVLAAQPDVVADLVAANEAVWQTVDPALAEVTRLRIAMMLGNDAELAVRTPGTGVEDLTLDEVSAWPSSPRFGARERACLTYLEQHLIDVANVSDEQAAAVLEHLGPQGLADYANAVLVLEQRQRLCLAWERLFSTPSPAPAG